MRNLLILMAVFATRGMFACDAPAGSLLSEQRYATTCNFASAAVAVSDDGALAAWHMTHAGFGSITGTNYGARLDESGRPLLPAQESLGGGLGRPAIASDGRDFLLVAYAYGVTSARVIRANGEKTDYVTLTTSPAGPFTNTGFFGNAYAVWTGDEYLVVTTEVLTDGGAYRARVAAVTLSRNGVPGAVTALADDLIPQGVAPAGRGRALVIWSRGNAIESAFVTGSALSSEPVRLAAVTAPLSVAAGDNGFLVVSAAGATLLDTSGKPSGPPIQIASEVSSARVVWEEDVYLVVFNTSTRIRAARVTPGGIVSNAFDLGDGTLWSAASARGRTVIAYGTRCGAIASRSIRRDETVASDESMLSVDAVEQLGPQLVSTMFGHQVTWSENGAVMTRFVRDDGTSGDVAQLSSEISFPLATAQLGGGSVIVWASPGAGILHVVRLDAGGRIIGETAVEASKLVFSISIAEAAGEIFIVTSGSEEFLKYEVYATRLDPEGTLLQRVLLSVAGEDGFNALGGGDAAGWIAAWRNGSNQLVTVEMPHDDLRVQSRRTNIMRTNAVAFLAAVSAGQDPVVVWTEQVDAVARVRGSFVEDGADTIFVETNEFIFGARIAGGEVFWSQRGETFRILSSPLTRMPALIRERACLSLPGSDFDVRGGSVSAIAYSDGPRLRVQLLQPPGPLRRRAAR